MSKAAEQQEEIALPAELMARLSRLAIIAPRVFPGSSQGKRFSRTRGSEGMEFAGHKEYSPGDDFRSIDWNVYARLEELVVKNFETQENLRLYVLLDCSASMASGNPQKGAWAKRLAAALAYIGFANEDWTGVFPFNKEIGESYLTKGRPRISQLLELLGRTPLSGRTDFSGVLKTFSIRNALPGLVFLISDFWRAQDLEESLKFLVYNHHSLVAIHVVDPLEQAPLLAGEMDLEDMETGETVPLTVRGNTLQDYQAMYQRHCAAVARAFSMYDAAYLRLSTQEPLQQVVLKTFRERRLVRQR